MYAFISTIALSLLLAADTVVLAQTPLGAVAPPLDVVDVVNHPAMRLEAIANQARVLCFVELADNDSLFFLEQFDNVSDELALEPISFFAVTNEAKAEIEKTTQKENVPTPILIIAGDAARKEYNLFKFPAVVVVDGAGKVRYCGMPGTVGEIRDAARDAANSTVLAPDLPAAAKPIAKLFDKWQIGEAAKTLDKELAKPKLAPADRTQLELAKQRTEILAARLTLVAERAEKAENWPIAVIAWTRLEKECAGMAAVTAATAGLEKVRERAAKDPAFAPELSTAKECVKAERLERDRDWKKAFATYSSAGKANPDTKSGKFALARAEALKSRVK